MVRGKRDDYIPLSEASKLTGYTIDHLRRLIVAGKMGGANNLAI